MSLLTTNTTDVVLKRGVPTNTDAMGNVFTYTTAARGSLPTSGSCRVMQASIRERIAFGIHDQDATTYLIFATNPRLDERDQVHIPAASDADARVLNVLTQTNPQNMNRFWIVACQESSRGVK